MFRRLERGTFQLPEGQRRAEVDPGELARILEGIDGAALRLRSVVRRALLAGRRSTRRKCNFTDLSGRMGGMRDCACGPMVG